MPDSAGIGRRLRWYDLLIGAAVAVVAVLVGWHWRAALIPIDPWDYVEGSINFPNGVWNEVGLSRWAMLAPIMVFAGWWGDSEATYYAYPLLAGGLLGATLYWLGARLVNRWCGLAAALFTLSAPVVLVHLSRGYPDLIALAFIALALLALLLARDAAHGWRWIAWLLVAGLAVGWAFEVRELTALAWPALAVALFRVGRPVRSFLIFAVPPLLALAADVTLSTRYFGDPLLKLHALTGNTLDQSSVAADAVYLGHDRWYYLTVAVQVIWPRSGGQVLLLVAAIGLIGGLIAWRHLSPVWLWGASVLGLLLLAGGFLRPKTPSIRLDIVRYNFAYLVPLVLCAICFLGILIIGSRGWRRVVAGVVAAILGVAALVPAVSFARGFEGLAPNGGLALRELGDFFAEREDVAGAQVWSDWGTQRLVPVYSRGVFGEQLWTAKDFRSLNRLLREPTVPASRRPQPGDYIVVYSKGDETCYHCAQALADLEAAYGTFPLPGWQPVFTSSAGNLSVYQLPPGYVWPEADLSAPTPGAASEGVEAP